MKKELKVYLFLIMNILLPLASGLMIYYYLSPGVAVIRQIKKLCGNILPQIDIKRTSWNIILRNYGPDILWGYAIVYSLFLFFEKNTKGAWKSFYIAAVFSASMEVLQLMPCIKGTFDILDILLEILMELVSVFFIKHFFLRGASCII